MNTAQAPEAKLASSVGRIAAVLEHEGFPPAERAALRRMNPEILPPLAWYRFALPHLPEDWDLTEERQKKWMTLVAGIALMSPAAHRPDVSLGQALGESGYSEARLERLLEAEGDTQRVLLLRAARYLAAKSRPFNWTEAALLLFAREENKQESIRRRIARDFYQAARKQSA